MNKFYIHPAQVIDRPPDILTISGDNDLDFTLQALKFYPKIKVECSGMDTLYESFWKTVKQVGAKEFTQFFSSQGDTLAKLTYEQAMEVANSKHSLSACMVYLLIQCSIDGTPYSPGVKIPKFLLYDSLKRLKKIAPLLERITFSPSNHSELYLCLNEFERDFGSRDKAILSSSLEEATKNKKAAIVSNIEFRNSKRLSDHLGNEFYFNA